MMDYVAIFFLYELQRLSHLLNATQLMNGRRDNLAWAPLVPRRPCSFKFIPYSQEMILLVSSWVHLGKLVLMLESHFLG